jgi:hypothetical protein
VPDAFSPLRLAAYVLIAVAVAALLHRYRRVAFRGVPELGPEAMGLFRIAFGVALFVGMARYLRLPDAPPPGGVVEEAELWAPWGWVQWLGDHWGWRDGLRDLTLAAIVCFTLGLRPRIAYVLVVAGFVLRLLVAQEYGGVSHVWVLYPAVLIPLVLVPWGDGLSLDNAIRRRRGRPLPAPEPDPRYGLAVWLPGLTLGVVWLAAAAAKLSESGIEWVTGGAVRYHWAQDHLSAPTSWGAWVAGNEWIAIAMSGAGVAIEALFISHVLFRGQIIRFGYGLTAFSLFLGFYLMQGVFWYPWWTLLLAFVPWEALARLVRRGAGTLRSAATAATARPRARPAALSPAVAAVVAALLIQQLAISRAAVEQMPFFSHYPMYSGTRASPEEFNAAIAPVRFYRYRAVTLDAQGASRDISRELYQADALPAMQEIGAWAEQNPDRALDPGLSAKLAEVGASYERRHGEPLRRVRLSGERRVFDFDQGKLVVVGRIAPMTFDFEALTVSS